LAEAAKKLGLSVINIEAVDRSGRGPDRQAVPNLPQTPDVVSAAFSSDVGVDTEALQLPNGGYLYFDVTGVTPSRERTLEEVKDQVEARFHDDEVAKRLLAKANDIVGKLKAGTNFAQAAQEIGLSVATATDLQRGKQAGFVPAKVVDVVFRTPKGSPGTAEGEKPTERFIFRVTDVVDPTLDASSPQSKAINDTLQNSYVDDIVNEFIGRLENDFGVNVNPAALNQATGGGAQQ
jgi:peptidyl-prolyl cis-trans isomerase D